MRLPSEPRRQRIQRGWRDGARIGNRGGSHGPVPSVDGQGWRGRCNRSCRSAGERFPSATTLPQGPVRRNNSDWTNPLRGSGAASAAMASRGKARHSGRAWCQHARNRIVRQSLSATLVDRLSQPRVATDTQRCLQRFDSAADLKQTKPILARSTPYPHWLYPPRRVFHRSAGCHWPTFTTIAPWTDSTAPASASRGARLG